jgi:hypothetical protein
MSHVMRISGWGLLVRMRAGREAPTKFCRLDLDLPRIIRELEDDVYRGKTISPLW